MNPQIWQKKYGREYHTLYVFKNKDGINGINGIKITCECLGEMYNSNRSHQAKCKHSQDLRLALKENNLKGWINVTPVTPK